MNKTRVATLLSALMLGSTAMNVYAECVLNAEGFITVSGDYYSQQLGAPYGNGGTSSVWQTGSSLLLNGTPGVMSGNQLIVTAWNLTGTLANNCTVINWTSGGTAWVHK